LLAPSSVLAVVASCVLGMLVVFAPSVWAAGTLYVSSGESDTVSAYQIAANGSLSGVPGSPFNALVPLGVAVTPDGKYLYVADTAGAAGVSAFSVAADGALIPVAGSPFPAKSGAWGVAIAPDGKHLYVADAAAKDVSAYTIESNGSLAAVSGSPFAAGTGPDNLAITPNGQYLYVANEESNNVSAFSIAPDGALSALSGSPYTAGESPRAVSLTPDGKHLYVANQSPETITAFSIAGDGTLAPVAGSPFPAPYDQLGVAVTPDGKHLYTTSSGAGEPLSAFSIAENGSLTAIAGSPFTPGGDNANSVAISPDSGHLFVSNHGEFEWDGTGPTYSTVSALSIAASGRLSAVLGSPFATGYAPTELVVSPDEGPTAAFSSTAAPSGDPTAFDATASSDPDFAPAGYRWEFGDGQSETTSSATAAHTYAAAGTYTVTLTVTDEAGCSTAQIFTGQTVSCNGSAKAQTSRQVTVSTGVRLSVVRTGSGSGTVSSEPSGVECGGLCSYAFGEGEKIKLTESPEPGSTFAGWSGGGCSGSETTCAVTISADSNVTATFSKVASPTPPNETPLSSTPQQLLPLPLSSETSRPSPSVKDARQSATRWRESNQLARISRAKTPTGTTFSFSLNEQATVSFSFAQLPAVHQGAHSCLATTREKVKRKNCNVVTTGTLSFTGHSGTDNVVFAGRTSHTNRLRPGRYELTITASNATGQRSAPVSLSFTITQ
jgi:6-phosphogluconolactonase